MEEVLTLALTLAKPRTHALFYYINIIFFNFNYICKINFFFMKFRLKTRNENLQKNLLTVIFSVALILARCIPSLSSTRFHMSLSLPRPPPTPRSDPITDQRRPAAAARSGRSLLSDVYQPAVTAPPPLKSSCRVSASLSV